MRGSIRLFVAGALVASLAAAGPVSTAAEGPETTLDRTIVADGEKSLTYGPAASRVTRKLDRAGARGRGKPIAGFKQLSDVHTLDEESPGRVEFFDMCDSSLTSAYRPQEAMTTQVGESMLRVLSKIKNGPATGRSLDLTISTGDNIDSNQTNELRWFIDLLDGEVINPDSGAAGYEGYTQEHFSGALPDEILEDAQASFDATGIGQPWYVVLGNHDGLVQGNIASTGQFRAVVRGDRKVFKNIETYECPDTQETGALAEEFTRLYLEESSPVTPDNNRAFLAKDDLIEAFDNTTGKPRGHGLRLAPDDPYTPDKDRAGYYSFPISNDVIGISMDTISYSGGPSGQLDHQQFAWIEKQLKKNSKKYFTAAGKVRRNRRGTNKFIVLFSHHTSTTLSNTSLPAEVPAGMAPLHCYDEETSEACAGGEGLKSLLTRYPNVIAWVNGHEHNNRITPIRGPKGSPSTRGLWEINTASHIDWPQQSRLLEVAYKAGKDGKPGSIFIYTTIVDHGANPDPDLESDPVMRLASISRVEAYYDACVREGQADCEAGGTEQDRNVKLVQKAPFRY